MSGQIVHLEPDPHAAVQRLLPWYLTGRLETQEHDAVEAHLAQCPECRAELETERQWQLLQPGHGAQVDVEEGWARMRARLGGETFPRPATAPAPAARRRGWLLPAWPAGAGAPAGARVGGARDAVGRRCSRPSGFTLRLGRRRSGDYHAALAAPVESGGATAVVRFRPDATEAQILATASRTAARRDSVDGLDGERRLRGRARCRASTTRRRFDKLRKAPGGRPGRGARERIAMSTDAARAAPRRAGPCARASPLRQACAADGGRPRAGCPGSLQP